MRDHSPYNIDLNLEGAEEILNSKQVAKFGQEFAKTMQTLPQMMSHDKVEEEMHTDRPERAHDLTNLIRMHHHCTKPHFMKTLMEIIDQKFKQMLQNMRSKPDDFGLREISPKPKSLPAETRDSKNDPILEDTNFSIDLKNHKYGAFKLDRAGNKISLDPSRPQSVQKMSISERKEKIDQIRKQNRQLFERTA